MSLQKRFFEIDEGQILIDGVDISTINPQIVRSLISVVPQNPVLFSMKISENIEYSTSFSRMNESCDFNDVVQASKLGNAHVFIMELRSGYETIVQQKSLSGGQKQRICLSRAFLPFIDSRISKHSVILLLDEATASLDTESEQMIQNALNQFDNGKITKIIIAHRLTTVSHADKIIVLNDGHVEEEGKRDDLIRKNGLYANLGRFFLKTT